MLLCVDVGNTQIALGVYADADEAVARPALLGDWRMRTDPRMTADELELAFDGLLGRHAEHVTGVAACSAVPSLLRELRLLIERRGSPAVVVGPGVRTGMALRIDNPRDVGADRLMNALAAHRIHGTACVVADFGTCTNIDVVSARGEFLGGALAPGIEISMEALAARTFTLRSVDLVAPRSVIGKNTGECLQSGALYGFAGQADGLVRRIVAELGPDAGPVTVIGTGALAPLVEGISETITEYVPDLTLAGLRLTYLRNVRPTTVRSGITNSPDDVSGHASR